MARPKKPDRLTNPIDVGVMRKMASFYALGPLDEIANEMESKWGVDRLPRLVSPETAAKFGSAEAKLDAAIDGGDHREVEHKAGVLMKGWKALDAEATKLGAKPVDPNVIETWRDDDGRPYALFKDNAEAISYAKSEEGAGVRVVTLKEISRIVGAFERGTVVSEVRDVFPGSELLSIQKPEIDWEKGDEIPSFT